MINKATLSQIQSEISNKNLIVVGEMHGVEENVYIAKQLIEAINKSRKVGFIGFEYPKTLQPLVNKLPESQTELLNHQLTKVILEDGRFSEKHLEFLIQLIQKQIDIVCFDDETKEWDQRDKAMFKVISSKLNSQKPNKVSLILTGNLHSKNKQVTINNQIYKPLGSYLSQEKTLFVDIVYKSGQYYNFGLHEFTQQTISENKFKAFIEVSHPTRKKAVIAKD